MPARARYAPLPNDNRPEDVEDEMEAAFEASDDEDDHDHDTRTAESRPLNPQNTSHPLQYDEDDHNAGSPGVPHHPLDYAGRDRPRPYHARTQSTGPGVYDFENADYDYPPPGSPPRRDRALPNNDWGNSNGLIPSAPVARPRSRAWMRGQGVEWARRVLPGRAAGWLGVAGGRERRAVGGGIGNDGVFANVTAKPTAPRQVTEEDDAYVVPEDAQKDAPPSYASAQADAVPPYWETTVHAPSSLSPGLMLPGELPIDGLATGTLFSFLWNMLVSISFQFVGFLLTYLLHTTHAAKLGARAGLGLTLVQYGFALRTGREDDSGFGGGSAGDGSEGGEGGGFWGGWGSNAAPPDPVPSFATATEAEAYAAAHNGTIPSSDSGYNSVLMGDMTTEWLSFLLMTIGWFILLNSLLGFWRIKRWERSILASHQENPDRPPPIPITPAPARPTGAGHGRQSSFALHFERTLGLRLPNAQMLRQGLGFSAPGAPRSTSPWSWSRSNSGAGRDERYVFDEEAEEAEAEALERVERGSVDEHMRALEAEGEVDSLLFEIPQDHPDRARLIAEAYANERRLQQDLRAAGLL